MRKTPNPLDKFANSTIANARNVVQMPRVPDYIRNFHSSPEWRKAWSEWDERLDSWRKNLAMSIGSPPATTGTTVAPVETGVVQAAPPTQHDHPISEVTDLQDTLDGKSDTGHTHEIEDVTGLQAALDLMGDGGSRLRYSGTASAVGLDVSTDPLFHLIPMPDGVTSWIPYKILLLNPSVDLSTAEFQFNNLSGAGYEFVSPFTSTALTAPGKFMEAPMASFTDVATSDGVYMAVNTSVTGGTVDVIVFYHDLSTVDNDE